MVQKGVSKVLKGHLLQVDWASFRNQKSINEFSIYKFYLQNRIKRHSNIVVQKQRTKLRITRITRMTTQNYELRELHE